MVSKRSLEHDSDSYKTTGDQIPLRSSRDIKAKGSTYKPTS
jgi:hypothetical protein